MRGWSNMDVLVDGLNLNKADRKRLEKINKINIHLQALFAAVEHGQVEKAKNILQNNTFDINCVNTDGLNVLEIAVMTGHSSLVRTLQQAGAAETNTATVEERLKRLDELVLTAERRRDELSCLIATKETERQHAHWDRKSKNLRKMRQGLKNLQVSGVPNSATVEVIDATRVKVSFQEPLQHSSVTTKFKVEWSADEWATTMGSLEICDLRRMSAVIEGLPQGTRLHFRVSAGNMKGFGRPKETSPPSAVPSSWRDIDNRKPRLEGLLRELEDLFNQVRNSRPEHASEIKAIEPGQETPMVQRKAQKKKSLMQLFAQSPKFQKNLKRGSYLACIIFCEDKILVTPEDFPPVVEVDENYLSQAKLHFYWLMKVATTWEDVKSLRQDMEQAGSSSHLPYRMKLLQAAAIMQSALGIQDLGQFYHQPIKDSSGTYVFCCVKHVKSTKSISAMNVRWVQVAKLRERRTTIGVGGGGGLTPTSGESPPSAGDLLVGSLEEQITYSQVSQVPLRRGLYIGYLKLQSSVDQLQVVVPDKIPNMFPHLKVRDNPHVSREEWEWVQSLSKDHKLRTSCSDIESEAPDVTTRSPSQAQRAWQKQLTTSFRNLLQEIGIEEESWSHHRLYTGEVLDLNGEVSLVILLPPIDAVCVAPGQEDVLLSKPSLTALPLNTFEMIHMETYQKHLMGRYARLSYILEMDILMAQHASREAFSEREVALAKERLKQLKEFQLQIDNVWKKCRWVMDAITFARDKGAPGVPLKGLLTNKDWTQTSRKGSGAGPLHHQDKSQLSADFLFSTSENKRLRKDLDSGLMAKESEHLIFKSNTTDNLKNVDNLDFKLPKSNTSECIFYSSASHLDSPIVDDKDYPGTIPVITWKAEDISPSPLEKQMYSKDSITTKSDYLLEKHSEEIYNPPRKSSAPSFLGADQACSQEQMGELCYTLTPNPSTSSLDCLEKQILRERKDSGADVDSGSNPSLEKASPTASCSELNQKYSGEVKRASSSLSRESETSFPSITASLHSLSSNETETDTLSMASKESARSETSEPKSLVDDSSSDGQKRPEESAIIRVYAAYETGLASGTSVKLQITTRTTAREIIDLVVKQLNMAVILKNKSTPIYGADRLKDFCLVAVIGARERCLRDDFKPLYLQNPWKTGRLYVRLKHDVLAAIEQSNSRHSSYL